MARRGIIVGASSGLGKELAKVMAADGWSLGLASRNLEALAALKAELGGEVHATALDVLAPSSVPAALDCLRAALGGVDCVVLSSGVSPYNRKLVWETEAATLATNVVGFAACANWAAHHFFERKAGHLVGLSSVAGIRGSARVPAYSASKAFVSRYLEGLRFNLGRYGVHVSDIRPGYVDTPMNDGNKGMLWVVSAEVAARQIYRAILTRKRVAYVPRRWAFVAALAAVAPGALYQKFSN
jgi:short-subunit dehydrogenase